MKLPFHGVQVCGGVLFAVKGGAIHSFQLADGSHVSSWRYTGPARDEEPPPAATAAAGGKTKLVIDVSEQSTPTPAEEDQGPPAKRVKLEDGGATPGEAAAAEDGGAHVKQTGREAGVEGNGEQGRGKGKKNKKQLLRAGALSQSSERPMVILTTATKDGCYLVAVTSDKSIWVFEHDGQGHLKQLSCRYVEISNTIIFVALVRSSVQAILSARPCVPVHHASDMQCTKTDMPILSM